MDQTQTVAQYIDKSDNYPDADVVTIADTAANIQCMSDAKWAAMAEMKVDIIDASDTLSLTLARFNALGTVKLTAADLVVLAAAAGAIQDLSAEQIAAAVTKGIDRIDVGISALQLTVAQFKALGSATVVSTGVKIVDSAAAISTLTPAEIEKLGETGTIKVNDGGTVFLTVAQAEQLVDGGILTDTDTVILRDTGAELSRQSAGDLNGLLAKSLDGIDAIDNVFTVTQDFLEDGADLLGEFADDDLFSHLDWGANLSELDEELLQELLDAGISILNAADDAWTMSATLGKLLAEKGVKVAPADVVTLTDTAAVLQEGTPDDIVKIASAGVDRIDVAGSNTLTLSAAQAGALAGTGMSVSAATTVTVAGTGTSLSGLSAAQIAGLSASGVDGIDASDNALSLTLAQFSALGSLTVAAGDLVSVQGTAGADTFVGRSGNENLFGDAGADVINGGAGNDRIFGGANNDALTGGTGSDTFVFNTKANKKTNFDKITDFVKADDTIELSKAVFTKLGKIGTLSKAAFHKGAAAHDANDRIIYNSKTGALFYDEDGTGAKAAVQFATLVENKKIGIAYNDFLVV